MSMPSEPRDVKAQSEKVFNHWKGVSSIVCAWLLVLETISDWQMEELEREGENRYFHKLQQIMSRATNCINWMSLLEEFSNGHYDRPHNSNRAMPLSPSYNLLLLQTLPCIFLGTQAPWLCPTITRFHQARNCISRNDDVTIRQVTMRKTKNQKCQFRDTTPPVNVVFIIIRGVHELGCNSTLITMNWTLVFLLRCL